MAMRSSLSPEEPDDSRSSSSTASPAPADNEESDFFLGANDSESSLGIPNIQDMQVDDSCGPPINRLPNEILISVFAKLGATPDLYHCMLVSKRWARNAVDLLWHRPACTNWRNHSSICQTLGRQHPFFSYRDFIKRLNLAALADKVNDGSVLPLAACTRVERLTLTNCRGLTDCGLIALVKNSPSLLALDISNDGNITERSINAIADNCKRLQGLNISGCDHISNESMINLAQNCKYIKRLKLNECAQLRDVAVLAFAENCPNILEIDLHQCVQIGNGPVTSLLSRGNCLRELRLANCELIDDGAFLSLPEKRAYEHLRILDLTSCVRLTDAAVEKIINVAPRLRNLVLAKCRNITDLAVHAISKLGKNLHYVHLGHCGQITDDGVKKLVQSCNRIRYIDLGCCNNLTDESVKKLALLPKLKRIGLVKCSSITDESVFALAEAAYRPRVRRDANGVFIGGEYYTPSLERVHLSYCINLTLKSIMRLLNSCPRLTHLSLTGVAAFQRDDFQAYCRVAPPEFTQHQRDVFCVFSGNMVSQFREFLNNSPRFEELRQGLPYRLGGSRIRGAAATRRSQDVANYLNAAEGEAFDDEMADEEADFEGLYGSDMIVDAQSQNPQPEGAATDPNNASALPPITQSIPVPPPAPDISQHPFGSSSHAHPLAQQFRRQQADMMEPLAYSGLMTNQSAPGNHGRASIATLYLPPRSPQAGSSSTSNIVNRASTAPMYGQPPDGKEQ
ncbi:SCF ubiquitin ligase complex subunit [Conoideocrella luteorostrata]|uniref:SCF ubiquitin ligase complex subunit n=1 Tax=Conoideocrella luteorostrata TaxID=1105319 RepID=A0AAJ0CQJ6_9HYPO|nr:SCF ubiquitin ligase complex subunit [Conoideocrella luteorostrata]